MKSKKRKTKSETLQRIAQYDGRINQTIGMGNMVPIDAKDERLVEWKT